MGFDQFIYSWQAFRDMNLPPVIQLEGDRTAILCAFLFNQQKFLQRNAHRFSGVDIGQPENASHGKSFSMKGRSDFAKSCPMPLQDRGNIPAQVFQ